MSEYLHRSVYRTPVWHVKPLKLKAEGWYQQDSTQHCVADQPPQLMSGLQCHRGRPRQREYNRKIPLPSRDEKSTNIKNRTDNLRTFSADPNEEFYYFDTILFI